MPVYNAASHLREALESILAQSMADFEIVAVNDGSSDDSEAILKSIKDPRLKILSRTNNLGIVETLNEGLAASSGQYIARMDADDVSHPKRFQIQYDHLEDNPEVGVCGTAFNYFGQPECTGWVTHHDHDEILIALLFENPICHPTVMLRKAVLDRFQLKYPSTHPYAEEFALWLSLSSLCRFSNLHQNLLHYRVHDDQVSHRENKAQSVAIGRLIAGQLASLGISPTRRNLMIHNVFGGSFVPVPGFTRLMDNWRRRLIQANQERQIYPAESFQQQLEQRFEKAVDRQCETLAAFSTSMRAKWRLNAGIRFLRSSEKVAVE